MGKPHSVLYGIPISEIRRICRVSLKTAQRWKAGQIVPGYCERSLLEGDLGAFGESWRGWCVRGEEILSPDGWRIRRDDALSVPLLLGQIAALRTELASVKGARDALEEQPAPGAFPAIIA